MKFCQFCNNMLYVNVNDEKDLVYYCKSCSHQEVMPKGDGSVCIVDDNKIDDALKYSQYINKNLKHDPTLPRVDDIACTNPNCSKPTHDKNQVIYINYNPTDMKFVYYCCYCDNSWINS